MSRCGHSGGTFEQRLRGQHKKLHPDTAWASIDRPADSTEGDEGKDELAAARLVTSAQPMRDDKCVSA